MVESLEKVIYSLQETSKVLSSKGAQEESALQEAMIQLLGFMTLEGREPEVVSIAKAGEHKFQKHKLADFKVFFADADVRAAVDESGKFTTVLYYIESKDDFETIPLFLSNYLSEDMIPSVLGFHIERLELHLKAGGTVQPFYTLPYFTITKFDGDLPDPTLGFVGKELRLRTVKEQDAVVAEASGNIEPYLRVGAVMLQGQGA